MSLYGLVRTNDGAGPHNCAMPVRCSWRHDGMSTTIPSNVRNHVRTSHVISVMIFFQLNSVLYESWRVSQLGDNGEHFTQTLEYVLHAYRNVIRLSLSLLTR